MATPETQITTEPIVFQRDTLTTALEAIRGTDFDDFTRMELNAISSYNLVLSNFIADSTRSYRLKDKSAAFSSQVGMLAAHHFLVISSEVTLPPTTKDILRVAIDQAFPPVGIIVPTKPAIKEVVELFENAHTQRGAETVLRAYDFMIAPEMRES